MSIQNVLQWFLPKEDKFFTLLEQQGNILFKTASILSSFNSNISNEQISYQIQESEHEGDEIVQILEQELALTFITPIDREDIHNLSTEIDDVIDFCNSAARVCVLYKVDRPTQPMINLINILLECCKEIHSALPILRSKDYIKFLDTKRKIKKLEKEADSVYRQAVSDLFHSSSDYKIFISQKSILEKLESAIDRCNDIACLLTNLAIKMG